MLWLFGQIWLWMLLSFALGVAVTALFFSRRNRPEEPEPAPEPEYAELLPYTERDDDYEDPYVQQPEPAYPPRPPLDWPSDPDERIETGHRQGMLPPIEWPPGQRGEDDGDTDSGNEEPAWPKAEDWPPAEHRPGRES
jgi:hypothetical protein